MKKMILIAALLAVSLVSKAQLVGTGITKSFHRLSFNLFNEILKTEEGNVCFFASVGAVCIVDAAERRGR